MFTAQFSLRLCMLLVCSATSFAQTPGKPLPAWSPGNLDIHQIHTGRGNAALLVFPDGTNALIDAGSVPDREGLELGPLRPNRSQPAAEWIARYIHRFAGRDLSRGDAATLGYAIMTHYHDDHIGALPSIADSIPIRKLIDRGLDPPPPNLPVADRYLEFRRSFKGSVETLQAGRADQIVAKGNADFEVRSIAANGNIWTGKGDEAVSRFPLNWRQLPPAIQPGENHFSLALRIRYGPFDYFTGGDLIGVPLDELPEWHDLETPVARAIGPVDALVLNHHGWLDTSNLFFLQTLQPRIVVIPAWHATHPDHSVLRRLRSPRQKPAPPDLFLTSLLDAPAAVFSYLKEPFRSSQGHVVIRVAPGGAAYSVIILDDDHEEALVKAVHGPYQSR